MAVKEYGTALRYTPDPEKKSEIYFRMGDLASEEGAFEAIGYYENSIKVRGNSTFAYFSLLGLARHYYNQGKLSDALGSIDRLLRKTPSRDFKVRALSSKARYLISDNRLSESRDIYYDLFQIMEKSDNLRPEVLFKLGWLSYRLDDYDNAREFFLEYINVYPTGARLGESLYWRGLSFFRQDKFLDAAGEFKRVEIEVQDEALIRESALLRAKSLYNAKNFIAARDVYLELYEGNKDPALLASVLYESILCFAGIITLKVNIR